MNAHIELPDSMSIKLVEHLHRRHKAMARSLAGTRTYLAMRACDLAQQKPKMKKVLFQAANLLDKWADLEYGRTMRDPGSDFNLRVPPSEAQFWREAYRCADEGKDAPECGWIYLACAEYLGLLAP